MPELVLKQRHRMKRKTIRRLTDELGSSFGLKLEWEDLPVDEATAPSGRVFILNGDIVALDVDGKAAPSLRTLLRRLSPKRFVTVDMGAVSFIYNGADVMAPGIKDAELTIQAGDAVYVRDIKNSKPLAVGVAIITGKEMALGGTGPAVKNRHHVGDRLWNFGHEDD